MIIGMIRRILLLITGLAVPLLAQQSARKMNSVIVGKIRILVIGAVLLLAFISTALASSISESPKTPDSILEFHSGFWVNLHHFLYWQALATTSPQESHPIKLTELDTAELNNLSAEERPPWDSAVAYYRDSLIRRDLLFDRGMEAIKNDLEDSEKSSDLAGVNVPSELKTMLVKAAPIYRKHWWQKHDSQNQRWVAEPRPLLQQHGNSIRDALVRIYDQSWPARPVRVDAVAYANWAGAYTTVEPTRPTISTTDPANQGSAALETGFSREFTRHDERRHEGHLQRGTGRKRAADSRANPFST
jgi:hypothetical protein